MSKHFDTPPVIANSGADARAVNAYREISDFYIGVIMQLTPRWRVCICRDGIQYILQKKSSEHSNNGVWLGKSYPTTRDSLIRICSSRGLIRDQKTRSKLEALPFRARDFVVRMEPETP